MSAYVTGSKIGKELTTAVVHAVLAQRETGLANAVLTVTKLADRTARTAIAESVDVEAAEGSQRDAVNAEWYGVRRTSQPQASLWVWDRLRGATSRCCCRRRRDRRSS